MAQVQSPGASPLPQKRSTFRSRSEQLSQLLGSGSQPTPTWFHSTVAPSTNTALIDPVADQLRRLTRLTQSTNNRQLQTSLPIDIINDENSEYHIQPTSPRTSTRHTLRTTLRKINENIPKYNELTFSPRRHRRSLTEVIRPSSSTNKYYSKQCTITNPFLYTSVNSFSTRLQHASQLYSKHSDTSELLPAALPAASSHAHLPPLPNKYKIQRSCADVLRNYNNLYSTSISTHVRDRAAELYGAWDAISADTQYKMHKQQSTAKVADNKLQHCIDMIHAGVPEYDRVEHDSSQPVIQKYGQAYQALTLEQRCKKLAAKLVLQHDIISPPPPPTIDSAPQHKQPVAVIKQQTVAIAPANDSQSDTRHTKTSELIDLTGLHFELANTQRLVAKSGRLTVRIQLIRRSHITLDEGVTLLPISMAMCVQNLGCVPTSIADTDIDLNETRKRLRGTHVFKLKVTNVLTELFHVRAVKQDDTLTAMPALERTPIASLQFSARSVQHSSNGRVRKLLVLPYTAVKRSATDGVYGVQTQLDSKRHIELMDRHEESKDVRIAIDLIFEQA